MDIADVLTSTDENHHKPLEELLSTWLRNHGLNLSWLLMVTSIVSALGGILVCAITILLGGMASYFATSLFIEPLPGWPHLIVGVLGLLALFIMTPPFSKAKEPGYLVTPLVSCDEVASYLSAFTLDHRNPKLLNLAHIGNLMTAAEMIGDILRLGPRLLIKALNLFSRALDIRHWHRMPFLVSMLGKLYSEDRKWTLNELASNPASEFTAEEVADMERLIDLDGVITLHHQPFGLKMGAELRNCIIVALNKG